MKATQAAMYPSTKTTGPIAPSELMYVAKAGTIAPSRLPTRSTATTIAIAIAMRTASVAREGGVAGTSSDGAVGGEVTRVVAFRMAISSQQCTSHGTDRIALIGQRFGTHETSLTGRL